MSPKHPNSEAGQKWKWWYNSRQSTREKQRPGINRILAQSLVAFAIAALIAFKFQRVVFAGIVAGIGLFMLLCGLLLPGLHKRIERVMNTIAVGLGQGLTWLLLAPFYFICFLPGRILLLLAKRDPMKRAWIPSAPTYWTIKSELQSNDRMTKQY